MENEATTVFMNGYGQTPSFNINEEDWNTYIDRLSFYFEANDIVTQKKKKAILLTVCGIPTYRTICNLLLPQSPKDVDFDTIVDKMSQHLQPRQPVSLLRYKFNKAVRKEGQSISEYVNFLRQLAKTCSFDGHLDEMLRDRLICGVNDQRIQRKLLAQADITFERALTIALAEEAAANQTSELQTRTNVYKISNREPQKKFLDRNAMICYRCNGHHSHEICRFKDMECRFCRKIGHIERACKSKNREKKDNKPPFSQRKSMFHSYRGKKDRTTNQNHFMEEKDQFSTDIKDYQLYSTEIQNSRPYTVPILVQDREVLFQIDTGASLTLVSQDLYKSLSINKHLEPSTLELRTYTGEEMKIHGTVNVTVKHDKQTMTLPIFVVEGHGPPLLGRNWLEKLKLDWLNIATVHHSTMEEFDEQMQAEFPKLFGKGIGKIKGVKGVLHVEGNATPRFFKPRPVPFAMKHKVSDAINTLEKEGIISKVDRSEWASPVVPVLKSNGQVRLCGDYRVTVNPVIRKEIHPIPSVQELFSDLSSGKRFTKIDLSNAYLQLELDENSKKFTTINTLKGLYQYNRLPFGISTCPQIFQRCMDSLLQGLKHVKCYLDDIMISGTSVEEHRRNVRTVLQRLSDAGIKVHPSKCEFDKKEISYLGHIIDEDGIRPSHTKLKAIIDAPRPKTRSEVKAFLGMINFYRKFIRNIANIIQPLNDLTSSKIPFEWTHRQEESFRHAKQALISPPILQHYDHRKKLVLSCDASPYGIGVVLSQREVDRELPIAFGSRSLSKAEQNYCQLEKEALFIVFGVQRFRQYLLGQEFTIITDHKPLLGIMGQAKPISQMSSSRIQRRNLMLGCYRYNIEYRKGKNHGNADALSRLPVEKMTQSVPECNDVVLCFETINKVVREKDISRETNRDRILSRVVDLRLKGWPENEPVNPELKPYYLRKNELSIDKNCVLWGSRVIVPQKLRMTVLRELHDTHPGIVKMKRLARSYFWWPTLDLEIESVSRECSTCQENNRKPLIAHCHPWEYPDGPWQRLHVDFAGPIQNRMILIVIDAYSKWIEAIAVSTASTVTTIESLSSIFATHGLPRSIVSDNATCFSSTEFKAFLEANGIKQKLSSPYHPSSNGLAERAVQIVKRGIQKIEEGSLNSKLVRFLSRYRITEQESTRRSPAEMLLKRLPRTRFDLMKPDVTTKFRENHDRKVKCHDKNIIREFEEGEAVSILNFGRGPKWLSGRVKSRQGPLTYDIELEDGRILKRHIDHILSRTYNQHENIISGEEENQTHERYLKSHIESMDEVEVVPAQEKSTGPVTQDVSDQANEKNFSTNDQEDVKQRIHEEGHVKVTPPKPTLRRSTRISKPPDRLTY